MKTTRHGGGLLSSTATVAALMLLDGVGASSRQADAAPDASARVGRYRLIYDTTIKTKKTTLTGSPYDIELKSKGQWRSVSFPMKGTYTIRNNVITFQWPQGRKMLKSTARLTRNGFAMPSKPLLQITFARPVKNPRYIKLP